MAQLLNSKEYEKRAITLTVDEDEFTKIRWIETDHEFLYQGKVYDMTSLITLPNHTSKIRCVEDSREAIFFQLIQQIIDQGETGQHHQQSLILHIFKFLSGLVIHIISIPFLQQGINSLTRDGYQNLYHFSFTNIIPQPPDPVSFSI